MRDNLPRKYSTLVWVLFLLPFFYFSNLHAAPKELQPDVSEEQGKTPPPVSKEDLQKIKEMDITTPPPFDHSLLQPKEDKYFYPYQKAMSPRMGMIIDSSFSEKQQVYFLFGINYQFESITSNHWEAGVDLNSNSRGMISLLHKWIFSANAKTRPFLKAGVSNYLNPEFGLSNFIRWRSYLGTMGLGIEDLLEDPLSVRADIELSIGPDLWSFRMVFGYSWAW